MTAPARHLPVLLASASPQRRAILGELDIEFDARSMDVAETTLPAPGDTVMENARRKLLAALATAQPGQAVIAADTIVWTAGKILGKPSDSAQAAEYLKILSGSAIQAYSGLAMAVRGANFAVLCAESATCAVRTLSDGDIAWYIATGEPLTRAGAIGISHYGEAFVTRIDGSYSCIAGFPKPVFLAALGEYPELAAAILPPNVDTPRMTIPPGAAIRQIAI